MSAPQKDSLAWRPLRSIGIDTYAAGVARSYSAGISSTVDLVRWHRQVIADCDRALALQGKPR